MIHEGRICRDCNGVMVFCSSLLTNEMSFIADQNTLRYDITPSDMKVREGRSGDELAVEPRDWKGADGALR